MKEGAAAGLGAAVALGVHLRWIRPRIFSWGATGDEASRPMAGRHQLAKRHHVPLLSRRQSPWIAATPRRGVEIHDDVILTGEQARSAGRPGDDSGLWRPSA